jgi:hypothetical protein
LTTGTEKLLEIPHVASGRLQIEFSRYADDVEVQ